MLDIGSWLGLDEDDHHARSSLTQRYPQEAVLDEAGQRFYRGAVFRNIAQEFPAFRCAVGLQRGGPIAWLARLQVETGLVPAAHETEIVGQLTVAR